MWCIAAVHDKWLQTKLQFDHIQPAKSKDLSGATKNAAKKMRKASESVQSGKAYKNLFDCSN